MAAISSLLAAYALCNVVHIFALVLAGWLVGAEIEEISFGVGRRRILQGRVLNLSICLRWMPAGSSVKFSDSYASLHPLKRVLVASSGSLALLTVACLIHGFAGTYSRFLNGFQQVIYGALAPQSTGPTLILAAYEFLKANPFLTFLGLLASKKAALEMLPIPTLNGGAVIMAMGDWFRPLSIKARDRVMMSGFVVSISISVCWIVAFCFFLHRV
jgi:membrane-associated protease RseP (regulator of RpoE activity)